MNLNPKIFKAYDIRGIYPKELDEEGAYKIGRAFACFLGTGKIVMGRDTRSSSPQLSKNFREGVLGQGIDVIDIGLASTPMLFFASVDLQCDGGVMVTASHNPKEYNGFKLIQRNIDPIGEESGLLEIKKMAEKIQFRSSQKKGKVTRRDFVQKYIAHVFKIVGHVDASSLKIVADAGNGMGGLVLPGIFDKLGCGTIPLFWELDGAFPNHLPNPSVEDNLTALKKAVIKEKADLGIAIDGDGDRIVFIDETGKLVSADFIMALLSKLILKDRPGSKIVHDTISSKIIRETIKKAGGQPIRTRVGHTFIKEKMDEKDVIFGGEASGHYYLDLNNCIFEAPFIMLGWLLRQMTEEKKKISQLVKPFKKYYTPAEVTFPIKDKAEVEKLLRKVEHAFKGVEIDRLDGITIEFKDWWFNLRPSRTTPLLRLNVEGNNREVVEKNLSKIKKLISGKII